MIRHNYIFLNLNAINLVGRKKIFLHNLSGFGQFNARDVEGAVPYGYDPRQDRFPTF